MLIRSITHDEYPAIVEIHHSLNIIWPQSSNDPDFWRAADQNRSPKIKWQRFVALEGDEIIGWASYANRLDDYHPQKFYINVEVRQALRRKGTGSALYNHLMAAMNTLNPQILRTDILQNQIQSLPFVQRYGFREVWRETPVHLDISGYDATPYEALETRLNQEGITINTLSQLKNDHNRDVKLHALYNQLSRDVPSEYAEFTPLPFDDWAECCLNNPYTDPDAFFIAVYGDQYIALHETGAEPGSPVLMGGLLGTLPEFRNKRIGLALIMQAIKFAGQHHMQVFKTCTAAVNAPMQALFTKLGFTRDPEWLQCQNDLA